MLPLLSPAALSDPSSHRNTQRLVHWSPNWKVQSRRILVTLLPQNIHWGVRGRGNYSASRDYDILQQTGLTILDTVLYFLEHDDYEPDWAYFNRHMRSSSGGPRTHIRKISRSIVLYIEDGAELIHRFVSEHLQLVAQHALRVSGRHEHSTLAVMCQRNPEQSQRHKLQMYCPWTMTFAEKPATHTTWPSASTLFLFSQTQVKQNQFW
jgi:hypothetical protein